MDTRVRFTQQPDDTVNNDSLNGWESYRELQAKEKWQVKNL